MLLRYQEYLSCSTVCVSMVRNRAPLLVKCVAALCVLVHVLILYTYGYLSQHDTIHYNKERGLMLSEYSFTDRLPAYRQTDDRGADQPEIVPEIKDSLTEAAPHTPTPSPPMATTSRGYALAEDFWEQLSSASRNMEGLQCWAKKNGVKVVEPFATNSVLRTPLAPPKFKLRFSDLIDLESWNRESRKNGNEEIVPWETFLKEAPKDVIAVQFKYIYSHQFPVIQKAMKLNPENYPPRERRYRECPSVEHKWPKQQLLEEIGFKIVRRVCLNFAYADQLTLDEFNTGIYDTLNPNTTTVYFQKWRGLSSFGRIPVIESGCRNTGQQETMPPSPKLIEVAQTYISRHVTGSSYIAIIARLEKSDIYFKHKPGTIQYCLQQTLNQWSDLVSKSGLNATFLAIDMGKYKSNSFRYDNGAQKEFERFFRSVYDSKWSISDWERSFEDVGGTTDAGYIALLQKIIVTRARCVLFVGGGSFQRHALSLYQARVSESEWCVDVVKKCTKRKDFTLFHD